VIHLTNSLVPLIALSLDYQNHSKWPKWGHVHYSDHVEGVHGGHDDDYHHGGGHSIA